MCCGGVRMRAVQAGWWTWLWKQRQPHPQTSPHRKITTSRHHHIATATKDFAQYRVYDPFTSRTASTWAGMDLQSASKCFCLMISQALGLSWSRSSSCTGAHSYSTTTHCKIFCRLHRLYYHVVMLRYFFHILFSSLCCAVIDFVAGIVHGVLFRYILLLGL